MSATGSFLIVMLVIFSGALLIEAVIVILAVMLYRKRGKGEATCGGCGYAVEGILGTTETCPECGVAFAEKGIRPASRGLSRMSLLIIFIGAFLPMVLAGGFIFFLITYR
ncbi:MAG: hypothetical protein CMJ32_11755 [Phycisphaerae bacterium]|nr:hypothetical protein [Phycisphaerae bacterium]